MAKFLSIVITSSRKIYKHVPVTIVVFHDNQIEKLMNKLRKESKKKCNELNLKLEFSKTYDIKFQERKINATG